MTVGDGHTVASGTMIVQADDAEPPNLHLISAVSPPFAATLSETWDQAAEDALSPRHVTWEWTLFHSGPIDTPVLSVDVDYRTPDSIGRRVLWRGELVESPTAR